MKIDLNKLKSIKLTKEQQQWLVMGVVGVAAGAYGYWTYLLQPINDSIAKKRIEVKTKTDNLNEARKLKSQEDQYNQRLAFVQAGKQFVSRRIPTVRDRLATISRINKILLEQNMSLVSYRAEADTGAVARSDIGDGYEKSVATIEVLSNYHGFGAFLSRLSAEDVVYNVDDVQLTQGDQSVKRGLVVASMKIMSHTEKAVPQSGAPKIPTATEVEEARAAIKAFVCEIKPTPYRASDQPDPFIAQVPLKLHQDSDQSKVRVTSLVLTSVMVGKRKVAVFRESAGPSFAYILVDGKLMGPDNKPVQGVRGTIEPMGRPGEYHVVLKQGWETIEFMQKNESTLNRKSGRGAQGTEGSGQAPRDNRGELK